MPRDVFAPLSEAITQGVVLSWKCRVGDHVKAGEVLAEIETDKANVDVEAPEDGVIIALAVPVGEAFARATALARLEPKSLNGAPSDLERNPIVPIRAVVIAPAPTPPTPEPRCSFCNALRVAGRHDCVRCGAPL